MRKGIIAAAAVLAVFAAGCSKCDLAKKEDIFAHVDRECITRDDFVTKAGLYNVKISNTADAESFLNGLINDLIILEQAKKDGIAIKKTEFDNEMEGFVPGFSRPEVKKRLKKGRVKYRSWLKDVREKIIIKKEINYVMKNRIKIEDDELKDYFWSNIIDFRTAYKVRASQIVVDDIEKAEEIRSSILKGDSFEDMARKYSTGSEAADGGDLGYFRKKDMPAFMSNVIFTLKEGKISHIVKTPYGYHIFKCIDIKEAKTPKYEEVKDKVYEEFFEKKKDEYFEMWLEEIRKDSKIEIKKENIEKLFEEEVK